VKKIWLTKIASTLLTLSVFALTGCATIPFSSDVQLGSDITKNSSTDFLYFSPYNPPNNASMSELLAGFLSAGTGPQNDYSVAREYLAKNLKTTWIPSQQVVVADSNPEINVSEENSSALVSVHSAAMIDAAGRMTLSLENADHLYSFGFVKEDGQWRISQAPNLTIVSRPVFDVVFKSYALYFFDSQRQYLVPDLRWFPSRASTATRLVNGLIEGPDLWLGDSVVNVIPDGTKLAVDAVTVTNGVASMDFNGTFLTVSKAVRSQIKAEIDATLGQIAGVRESQISVDRNVQNIATFAPKDISTVTVSPLVLTSDSLSSVSANTITQIDSTKLAVSTLRPYDFAVSSDESSAAFVSQSGLHSIRLETFGAGAVLLDSRADLLAPKFDRQGWLWSVGSKKNTSVQVFSQSGEKNVLQTSSFVARKVLSFSLSPEGARMAAVVETTQGSQVWLFGVIRNKKGMPVALSQPFVVASAVSGASDVSWLDGSKLGLLGKAANGWSQPVERVIGGFEQQLAGYQGLRQFVGSSGARYALTTKGELLQFRGSTWTPVQLGIQRVHFFG